jgi:tetratricopeptide (TPR) repeat protein
MMSRVAVVAIAVQVMMVTSCVTAPSRVDVNALVKRLGPVDARHELEVRIVDDPKDIAARLALAKLCEEQKRPSQALEQLEAVIRVGGPIGTRWHDEDRARFARLLYARGLERTTRGAPTAIDDMERARSYGAKVSDAEIASARLANALVHVRHIDAKERATGIAMLKKLGKVPASRGELGAWLWSIGAKRAAWEELAAWHDATKAPRDERLQIAYLVARAWWTPYDGLPPTVDELVGPERCRYGACKASDLVQNGTWSEAIAALRYAPPRKVTDPQEAYAWLVITLAEALRGEGSWAALYAGRVDVNAIAIVQLPPSGRAAFALVTGRDVSDTPNDGSIAGRFLAAGVAAARGGKAEEVRGLLGNLAETRDGLALVAAAAEAQPLDAPYAAGVARFVAARTGEQRLDRVKAILDGYARDPLIADRLARDVVAEHADAAAGHAFVATLFDAIEDPARARESWQAAVDDSPGEPAYVRGLAEAIARAKDPDAALVFATQAAAAAGDPAPVWIAIARALHGVGADVHALQAARFALDLASGETIADALDVAIVATDALGRPAGDLRTRRARVAPPLVDAMQRDVTTKTKAQLVELAGDPDIDVARAAIRALR